MATPRVSPVDKSIRRFAKAYVAARCEGGMVDVATVEKLDRMVLGLAHWYEDDLDDWDCDCDACSWWKDEIHRAGRARN